ncbi:Choline-sulfatase [Rubripirellula tenax]|uniref:Choline-sulfatase n=1 Tax=Rubripirellula tenax TaxID=2528015 RepID=A0A5C6EDX4_9BACT|nr:sulfatase [Rubripirellula tenax]TWU46197.1 Choline-sulfatase [Rubripirellula tenax]
MRLELIMAALIAFVISSNASAQTEFLENEAAQRVPAISPLLGSHPGRNQTPPNVLFIAIDDINDWVGPLGGHPQAQTPNMDRFCRQESVLFSNAVCAAPICGPSRSAILSGFMPNRTGVYGNGSNMLYSETVKTHATLPEYFSKYGYHTLSNGKVFHKHGTEHGVDFGHWAFDEHARARQGVKDSPDTTRYTSSKSGVINGQKRPEFKSTSSKLTWGPTTSPFEETVDFRVADWSREQLTRDFDRPFFMAIGFIKPHLPWVVPQEFFDKYDRDSLQIPDVKADDLEDILLPDGKPAFEATGEYRWIQEHGLQKDAVHAYLASITYVDTCLGLVLEALEQSGHADNTIIVIWGDHGWHLGEKHRYLKNTVWNESAKTPLIVRTPGMTSSAKCNQAVSLIDLYPKLVSLCGLPAKELDGHDFTPLLQVPTAPWDHFGVTVSATGTSVMGERYHYIHHLSGAEEFYDLSTDPMEWTNLVRHPEHAQRIAEMKRHVPQQRAIFPDIHFDKPPNYVDADADPTLKSKRNLSKLK